MLQTNKSPEDDEYRKRARACIKAIFKAGEQAGLNKSNHVAENFQGCSLLAFRHGPYKGDVIVKFWFGLAPKLLENTEFTVSLFVENVGLKPYLCDSREVAKEDFSPKIKPQEWLVRNILKAIDKVRVLCREEQFNRLKELHRQRVESNKYSNMRRSRI
jgi:hypothetical protein